MEKTNKTRKMKKKRKFKFSPQNEELFEGITKFMEKNEHSCFLANFLSFDEEGNAYPDIRIFGDKEMLVQMLKHLKEVVKTEADKDGWVGV